MDYKRFIVFVVVLIAALSIGMTAYYFLRDNETIVIKNVEVYVNKGDTFNIEVERQDPKPQTTISFSIADTNIVTQETTGEFLAKEAGETEITLITNKQRIETQKCIVHVGDGSAENPYFIKDVNDLKNLGNSLPLNKNYKVIANIDMSGEENWTPIAKDSSFTGIFDGNGYAILNLKILATQTMQYAGLFEKIGANGIIKDLAITNANISGNIVVAGVVSAINNGIIQCVKVEESSLSSAIDGAKLGGIVAQNVTTESLAKLDRVASHVVISSTERASIAGIACENKKARILNSYFQGRLSTSSAESTSAGLVVENIGEGNDAGVLKKCYAAAEYTSNIGAKYGMVARNVNGTDSNKIFGLYYDSNVAGEGVIEKPEGYNITLFMKSLTTEQMRNSENYVYYIDDSNVKHYWNFDIIWSFGVQEYQLYPMLLMLGNESDVDPGVDGTTIITVDQLKNMSLNGSYKLGADIDLAGEINWAPIGTADNPFQGSLDGDGYKITNLKITSRNTYNGLFGYIGSNATIKNIQIEGVDISDGGQVGALAGRNDGYIQSVKVSGVTGASKIQISSTMSYATVGSIVGFNAGTILGAQSNTLNITVSGQAKTIVNVGGVVGVNEGYIYSANSDSFINIDAFSANAGGVVGHNTKFITNSKFKGTLIANTNNEGVYVGGIAGYNISGGEIELSGIKAQITGYNAGGVVGFNNYGIVNRCYVLDGSVLTGNKVGGIISSLQRGKVNDSFAVANLVGSSNGAKKAGFAVYVQGHTDWLTGEGECAEMNHCFSACTFDNTGDNYCESSSETHVSLAGTNHNKEAGYINNSVYDRDKANNARKSNTSATWWWGPGEDVGDRSTSECQSTGTFTDRGFSSITWNLSTGSYPLLNGTSYDYFNNNNE